MTKCGEEVKVIRLIRENEFRQLDVKVPPILWFTFEGNCLDTRYTKLVMMLCVNYLNIICLLMYATPMCVAIGLRLNVV